MCSCKVSVQMPITRYDYVICTTNMILVVIMTRAIYPSSKLIWVHAVSCRWQSRHLHKYKTRRKRSACQGPTHVPHICNSRRSEWKSSRWYTSCASHWSDSKLKPSSWIRWSPKIASRYGSPVVTCYRQTNGSIWGAKEVCCVAHPSPILRNNERKITHCEYCLFDKWMS